MDGHSLFWFIQHLGNNFSADGVKRVIYSIVNIFLVAAAAGCVYGIVSLADSMSIGVVLSIVVIIVLIVLGLYLLLNGVVGQFVLLIMSGIGMFADHEHRASAIIAFFIALLSFVALAVVLVILL